MYIDRQAFEAGRGTRYKYRGTHVYTQREIARARKKETFHIAQVNVRFAQTAEPARGVHARAGTPRRSATTVLRPSSPRRLAQILGARLYYLLHGCVYTYIYGHRLASGRYFYSSFLSPEIYVELLSLRSLQNFV